MLTEAESPALAMITNVNNADINDLGGKFDELNNDPKRIDWSPQPPMDYARINAIYW